MRTVVLTLLVFPFAIHHCAAQADTGNTADSQRPALSAIEPTVPTNPGPSRLPGSHKVKAIDGKFVAVMATLGAAESMRITTRDLVLENEMAAGAPWVTSTPSHSQLVVKYSPIFAAELVAVYELKKPHDWLPGDRIIRKFWWAYPAAMTVLHVKNAIGSIRTSAPAACVAEQCQLP